MHKTLHKKIYHQPLRTHVKLEEALRNDVVKAGNNDIQVFHAITFRNEIIIFNTGGGSGCGLAFSLIPRPGNEAT